LGADHDKLNSGNVGIKAVCRATTKSEQSYQVQLERFRATALPTSSISKPGELSKVSDMALALVEKVFENPSAQSYYVNMGELWNRRLFMSEQGYVGHWPARMQSGDVICVLLGC
jgi:hypothetical protein